MQFYEQNLTKYACQRLKYQFWRCLKHTLKSENTVVDSSCEYTIAAGEHCECGIGRESGIPCSHELYMLRRGHITELKIRERIMERWYQKYDALADEKIKELI